MSALCHSTDAIRAQFLKVNGTSYVVVCTLACCVVYNANCTRKLFSYDISTAIQSATERPIIGGADSVKNQIWFTCSVKAIDCDSGEEFIAVATNDGRVYSISV